MLAELSSAAQKLLQTESSEYTLYVKFRTRNGSQTPQFYRRKIGVGSSEKEEYLSAEDLAADPGLVRSYCAGRILKEIDHVLRDVEKIRPGTVLFELQDALEEMYLVFDRLMPKKLIPNRVRTEQWANRMMESSFRREELTQPTRRGDKVRSKLEAAIANVLFEEDIPYRYEQKLELDHKLFLPDFMLADPLTGKFTYLEAFGMMEKADYAIGCMQKLGAYAHAGLYPGDRLMLVFESPSVPFDQEVFRQWVRHKFRLDERQRYRREKEKKGKSV